MMGRSTITGMPNGKPGQKYTHTGSIIAIAWENNVFIGG